MGLIANRPIGVAPYMGENAFIAFGLAALGIGWQLRIGAVFVSGVVFLIITLLRVRGWLANSICPSMKYAFAVGIGLFLAFIGLVRDRNRRPTRSASRRSRSSRPAGRLATADSRPAGIAVPVEIGSRAPRPGALGGRRNRAHGDPDGLARARRAS